MSGFFTGLNLDNLFVECRKSEDIDYNNFNHLSPISDHYDNLRLLYNYPDYEINIALSTIIQFIEDNKHLFFDYEIVTKTLKDFFSIYTKTMFAQVFELVSFSDNISDKELKKAYNSIMFIQYSTPVDKEQRKIKNLMLKTLKSLLTLSCEEKKPLELDNHYLTTANEHEEKILDFNGAELFLEGEYHLRFETELLKKH